MASNEVQLLAKRGSKWVAITADGQQVVVSPGMKLTVGLSTQVEEPDGGEVKSLYDCYHDGSCPPDLEKMLPVKVEKALENAPDTPANTAGMPPPGMGEPDADNAPPLGLPGGPAGPPPDALMAAGPMGGGMPPPDAGAPPPPMDAPPPPSGLPGGPGGPDMSDLMGAPPDDTADPSALPLPRKGK